MEAPKMQYIDAKYDLLINGEWVPAEGGETFETFNPANGEKLADCANASPADIDRAVAAARAAFPAWAAKSPQERAALLLKVADLIDENAARLAMVETLDNGKPIRETTLVDVPLSSDHFRYFAGCLRAEEGSAALRARQAPQPGAPRRRRQHRLRPRRPHGPGHA